MPYSMHMLRSVEAHGRALQANFVLFFPQRLHSEWTDLPAEVKLVKFVFDTTATPSMENCCFLK